MKKLLALIPLFLATACTTPLTPQQQAAIHKAEALIGAAVGTAIQDYAGGKTNKKQVVLDSVSSAAAELRTLQTTPAAASPAATQAAVQQGSANPAVDNIVAPKAAAALNQIVSTGVDPSKANEIVAKAMDAAAKPN